VYIANFVDKISSLEADKSLRHGSQHAVRQFVLYGHIRHFVSKYRMWPGSVPKNVLTSNVSFVTHLKAAEGVPQNNLSRNNIAVQLNSAIATQFWFSYQNYSVFRFVFLILVKVITLFVASSDVWHAVIQIMPSTRILF
jgi:hypothetical protein